MNEPQWGYWVEGKARGMFEYATMPGGRHVDVGNIRITPRMRRSVGLALDACKSSQATSEVAWCAENSEEKKTLGATRSKSYMYVNNRRTQCQPNKHVFVLLFIQQKTRKRKKNYICTWSRIRRGGRTRVRRLDAWWWRIDNATTGN